MNQNLGLLPPVWDSQIEFPAFCIWLGSHYRHLESEDVVISPLPPSCLSLFLSLPLTSQMKDKWQKQQKFLFCHEQTHHFTQEHKSISLSLSKSDFVSFYDQASHGALTPLWQLYALDKDLFLQIRTRVIPERKV